MANGNILARYQPYSPGTPANYPGVAPTINQEALDSAASMINYANARQVFVDVANGSDVTGTGAQLRPYQTIEAAFAAIALLPAGNYVLMLAPGAYGVAPIAWPVVAGTNISVFGYGDAYIAQPITYTAIGGVIEESVNFQNVGITDITVDLTAAAGKVSQLLFSECAVGLNRIDTLAPGPQVVRIFNSFITSLSTTSVVLVVNGQWIGGPPNAVGATGQLLIQGGLASAMVFNVAAGGQILIDSGTASFSTFNIDGTLTLLSSVSAGATIAGTGTLVVDASSLSFAPTVTVATVTLADNAENVGFSPAVAGDWPTIPTEVKEGLDELAVMTNVFNPAQVYVDVVEGSDVTGTGAKLRPFQSIPAALAYIAGAGAGSYILELAPGSYAGAPIAWPNNVSINAPTNTSQIDHVVTMTSAIENFAFAAQGVGFSNPVVIDMALATSAQVRFFNCGVGVQRLDSNASVFMILSNCGIGSADITGNVQIYDSLLIGGATIQAASTLILRGCTIAVGPVNAIGTIVLMNTTSVVAVAGAGTALYDSTSAQLIAGAGGSITTITQSLLDDAETVSYTAAQPILWSTNPTQVAQALDILVEQTTYDRTTFIYQPGGVAAGNVYTSWANLYSALNLVDGPRTVYFDDTNVTPAVIPAGAYSLEGVIFDNAKLGQITNVQVADGVSWTGLAEINNINLEFLNTATVETLSARAVQLNGASIAANGTAAIWEIPAGAQFQLYKGSAFVGTALAAVANIQTGQILQLVLAQVSTANTFAISSPAADPTAVLVVLRPDETGGFTAQAAQFGGTLSDTPLQDSANLFYSPAVPADWITPPAQVAEALDELAARPSTAFAKEIGIVSAPQAAAKQIDLAILVDHASVIFTVVGLTGLVDTISYQLTDAAVTTIDWNGLGLDGVLLAGADFQVQYLPA